MAQLLRLNPARVSRDCVLQTAVVVRRGGVIVYPTDTIYGLGCDAWNEKAIRRIYRLKHRQEKNPALVLVSNMAMVRELVTSISPMARILMKTFWPGPLTILLPARKSVLRMITSADRTIGIRIPGNKFCLRLIRECGVPLVSTSANISGSSNIPDVSSLIRTFSDSVDLIVDGGEGRSPHASTVVDSRGEHPVIIREGAISSKEIFRCLESGA